MKKYFPYFFLALPFFLLKITNLGIWLSDTNIYFYTGYQLLQGKILYKDIFFTNFPLLPYISSLYFLLTAGNLPLFFFTSSIEAILVGFMIYIIVLKECKSKLQALLASSLYLYSFIVLATSNHQTGVFIASLFAILAYLFFIKQKLFLSGVFIALALLTKAYFLPIALALFITLLFTQTKKSNNLAIKQINNSDDSYRPALPARFAARRAGRQNQTLVYFLSGFFLTILIILLPSLLLAPHDLFRDVISYSLTRSQGIPKGNIARFFLIHDGVYVLLLFWNILMIRKRLFFGLVSLLSLIFFLLYQDIYYLYLNFHIPFLAISFPTLYSLLQKTFSLQKMVLPTIIGIILLINLSIYIASYQTQQKIENIQSISALIKKQSPDTLYGINSLTPALSYLTNTPLLDNIVDTNENIYRRGFLDKKILTRSAISSEAVLVTSAAIYPEANANYPLLGGIFEEELIKKSCRLIGTFFIKPEGVENAINIFSCKKQ